jgi:formate hydrogenlyase subunit 3/multisubunit Na+/H+ antiporter MnhD subunit
MFFGSSKNGIEPDFAVIGIAGFGGIIVTSIIGRSLFSWFTKRFFGGDEEKAKRIDKIMTVAVMLLWMIVFCFGINMLQKRL